MSQPEPKRKFNFWAYANRQQARGEKFEDIQRRCAQRGGVAHATVVRRRQIQQERFVTMMAQQKLETPFTPIDEANIRADAARISRRAE